MTNYITYGQAINVQTVIGLADALYVFNCIVVMLTNLVFWAFAFKYWVVSKKVEMFQEEIHFETKERTFSVILLGGIAFFTTITVLSTIP
jgi:uncharacterized membrane protein